MLLVGCANPRFEPWFASAGRGANASDATGELANAASPAAPVQVAEALAKFPWVLTTQVEDPHDATVPYRWRHQGLEELTQLSPDVVSGLRAALASEDAGVRATAAIGLARAGEPGTIATLVETVSAPAMQLATRRAAAEALAVVAESEGVAELRRMIDRLNDPSVLGQSALLHAELLRGLSRHVDPTVDPRFVAALTNGDPDVRREAVIAWVRHRGQMIPEELEQLRSDTDPQIRALVLHALAVAAHPQAAEWLETALRDPDFAVQQAAVEALGTLASPEAIALLREHYDDWPDRLRAIAVDAFARVAAEEELVAGVRDEAWRVRIAAAEALSAASPETARRLVRELIADRVPQVRVAAIEALADWPLEEVGALLLTALESDMFLPRKRAAETLAALWPPAARFRPDASAEQRTQWIEELKREWEAAYGPLDEAVAAMAEPVQIAVDPAVVSAVSAALRAASEGYLPAFVKQQIVGQLKAVGPSLVPALEKLRAQADVVIPELIYRDVLPEYSEAFGLLVQLADADVSLRRQAVSRLVELHRDGKFSSLVWSRLAELTRRETDPTIWREVMQLLAEHPDPTATDLAAVALSHADAGVRRLACEFYAAYPEAASTPALIRSLDDPHPAVVAAAIRALGELGQLPDPTALERMLLAQDAELRIAAARSLVQVGASSGVDALRRLAQEVDVDTRVGAIVAIGELADPVFLPVLIARLDDANHGVLQAVFRSLTATVGRDVANSPGAPVASSAEQAARWRTWWRQQQLGADGS